ncbi:DNA polymerase ligase N-terminal domain-containing protein [Streptomyces sp. NPDC056638]|uniref:DNA polymerase ligase N-terminal domain-containing protein n=1 Tax=Streptomyces sp. NPDC056638 TaxID=3345887 RepID=UPI003673B266
MPTRLSDAAHRGPTYAEMLGDRDPAMELVEDVHALAPLLEVLDDRERHIVEMHFGHHSMEYRDFEGVVAEGEYGAGTVIVWDEGSYRPLPGKTRRGSTFSAALEKGHASFWLDGSKAYGGYALTRFRGGGSGGRGAWLPVKESDERAGGRSTPDAGRAQSVRTGRTLKCVADEEAGAGGSGDERGK